MSCARNSCAVRAAGGEYHKETSTTPSTPRRAAMTARPQALLRHIRRLASAPDPDTDAALLERFARLRDESAFASLVSRHGLMVLGVCRRVLRDAHQAEDAFQATFLVLARKAGTIRRPETLAA